MTIKLIFVKPFREYLQPHNMASHFDILMRELEFNDDLYENLLRAHSFPGSVADDVCQLIEQLRNGLVDCHLEKYIELVWDSYLEYKENGYCLHGDFGDSDDEEYEDSFG